MPRTNWRPLSPYESGGIPVELCRCVGLARKFRMANLQRDLEAAVFDEGRVVTYLTLCREKRVTAEEAKRYAEVC